MLRKLTTDDVEISLTIHGDEDGPRGQFASGDDARDEEIVQEILTRLNRGDLWAWCVVTVEARWKGFSGTNHLGGCSYENEADFKQEGGYYQQMVNEAVDELNEAVAEAYAGISELVTPG